MLGAILSFLGGPVAEVIDKVIPDKDKAAQLKHDLQVLAVSQESELIKGASAAIKAEAESEHQITATWRPILMLSITAILVNNFLLAPYMDAIFGWSVYVDAETAEAIPEGLWTLLTVGVGGYVMGRSAEKAVKNWPKSGK